MHLCWWSDGPKSHAWVLLLEQVGLPGAARDFSPSWVLVHPMCNCMHHHQKFQALAAIWQYEQKNIVHSVRHGSCCSCGCCCLAQERWLKFPTRGKWKTTTKPQQRAVSFTLLTQIQGLGLQVNWPRLSWKVQVENNWSWSYITILFPSVLVNFIHSSTTETRGLCLQLNWPRLLWKVQAVYNVHSFSHSISPY